MDFLCKGLDSHKNKIIVFGDNVCKVGNVETIGTENEDEVGGFDGVVISASFVDNDAIAIVTTIGLYVFNFETSIVTPSFSLLWMENFTFSSVGIDSEDKTIFILNSEGVVKKCNMTGFIQNSEFMETLKKINFLDLAFIRDKKAILMKDRLGLWSYDSGTGGWTPLFLVCFFYNGDHSFFSCLFSAQRKHP